MNPSPPRRAAAQALGCAALGCAALGCDSEFEPYNRLSALRVLAVQSEPASPGPNETALLTPLTFVPEGESATFSWSWCPIPGDPAEGSPCLVDEDDLRAALGDGVTVPSFDLGSEGTARFRHDVSPDLLRALCAGQGPPSLTLSVPDCVRGFPIQIRLVLGTGSDQVVSVKRLVLRFDAAQEPNQNPVIESLSAAVDGAREALDDAATIGFPRGRELALEAGFSDAQAELYTDLDDAGLPTTARERLLLTWFVEAGETEVERTSFVAGELALDEARRNLWRLPRIEAYPADTARLVLVARDQRGGVGWRAARIGLGGTP